MQSFCHQRLNLTSLLSIIQVQKFFPAAQTGLKYKGLCLLLTHQAEKSGSGNLSLINPGVECLAGRSRRNASWDRVFSSTDTGFGNCWRCVVNFCGRWLRGNAEWRWRWGDIHDGTGFHRAPEARWQLVATCWPREHGLQTTKSAKWCRKSRRGHSSDLQIFQRNSDFCSVLAQLKSGDAKFLRFVLTR